jgi:DNA mismatch repair protein MutS
VRENSDHVLIDAASQRNLDLVESRSGKQHTLLGVLDRTATPMGARLLRDWILHPLRDLATLTPARTSSPRSSPSPSCSPNAANRSKASATSSAPPRRLSQNSGNARDLQSLAISLSHIPALKEDISSLLTDHCSLITHLHDFSDLTNLLQRPRRRAALQPPRRRHHPRRLVAELDELRNASRGGKDWIARLQEDERKRTGIDSLKIKFNNVFGYFIESPPPTSPRSRTTTPASKPCPTPSATSPRRSRRWKTRCSVPRSAPKNSKPNSSPAPQPGHHPSRCLQQTAAAVAEIDVLCALAEVAQFHRHCRPVLNQDNGFFVTNGRHPVLEQTLTDTKFVPNDTELDPETARLQILTGPNMAGKSTYIRQIALIAVMAQIGAFVPATPPRSAWWTASSAASARPTTSRAANPPSWSR